MVGDSLVGETNLAYTGDNIFVETRLVNSGPGDNILVVTRLVNSGRGCRKHTPCVDPQDRLEN